MADKFQLDWEGLRMNCESLMGRPRFYVSVVSQPIGMSLENFLEAMLYLLQLSFPMFHDKITKELNASSEVHL